MQEGLKEKQSSTSSRASSFFIENILASGQDGHRSTSSSGRSIAGAECVPASGALGARQAEAGAPAPDASDAAVLRAYRESPLQWYRDASGLNLRPLDAAQSK